MPGARMLRSGAARHRLLPTNVAKYRAAIGETPPPKPAAKPAPAPASKKRKATKKRA
ncbi:MAG: hypothetical protein WDN72_01770 [Alphaproteobacteria bacterium]